MAKLNQVINKALTNKYVLYVVTFLAVTNILGYLAVQNTTSVIFFVLLAFLTQYFSKNMTVILLTAMVGTSMLFVAHNYGTVREGMTAKEKAERDQKRQKTLEMSKQEEKADTGEEDDEVEGFGGSHRIDRKKTNQQAFESIQSQLGPDGVKGLQADTQALMSQQKELMETMKSLEPMMNTAKGMLNSLDMGTLNKMTDLVGGLGLGKK